MPSCMRGGGVCMYVLIVGFEHWIKKIVSVHVNELLSITELHLMWGNEMRGSF